ncbi:cytochrome P450 [Xylaria sp. FL0043]|nr:cytochrome P450 [Xylaria sp. FL0043]
MDHIRGLQTEFDELMQWVPWVLFLGFALYCIVDALSTMQLVQRAHQLPLVGGHRLTPKFVTNLAFTCKAADILTEGYHKFKTSAFQLIRGDGRVVILPLSLLEELSALPPTIANPQAALEHDLLGQFTGLNLIIENRLHHIIVQRKLTPRIPLLVPRIESSIAQATEELLPQSEEWSEILAYQVMCQVSARSVAHAIVGPAFCEEKRWLKISCLYTESLFRTIVILRTMPEWMQNFTYFLLPSYWDCQKHLKDAKLLLSDHIQQLIDQNDAGLWEPRDDSADDLNVLSWLSSMAKGRDRNPHVIAHVLVLVALAAVHTTLLRMVNVLYDITAAGPDLKNALIEEIKEVSQSGWSNGSYDNLHRLDSVMRESQRRSPPTILGLKRLFRQPYTFQDGTHVSAGTYVSMPIYAIENDEGHTHDPHEFDGLRSFRVRQELEAARGCEADTKSLLFSSPTRINLNFGYGKTACPGRFFASQIIKIVLVKLLTEYEFKFLTGETRPQNILMHEFLFTWPWQKMLARRQRNSNPLF